MKKQKYVENSVKNGVTKVIKCHVKNRTMKLSLVQNAVG